VIGCIGSTYNDRNISLSNYIFQLFPDVIRFGVILLNTCLVGEYHNLIPSLVDGTKFIWYLWVKPHPIFWAYKEDGKKSILKNNN
jgi:hypothetical protein